VKGDIIHGLERSESLHEILNANHSITSEVILNGSVHLSQAPAARANA
jgi:hypothetical protein